MQYYGGVCGVCRQELGWSAPSYMMSEPPAGLMSPVPVAAAPCDLSLSGMVQPPAPQQFGVQLVGSPIFPPQVNAHARSITGT